MAMATLEECRRALERLAGGLATADATVRGAAAVDRSVSCHLTDLGVTFGGRLRDGRLCEVGVLPTPPRERAAIRLTMTGDDLVALVDGRLNFTRAWGSGRIKLEAGLRDLLRLRSLL